MREQRVALLGAARKPFRRTNIAAKVRDASDLYVKLIRARVRAHGLSLNQYRLLREVWEDEGVTQRAISERMRVSEPATVATIDSLVADGLVRRMRTPDDKRKSLIFLTRKGEALRDRILEINDGLNVAALHGLSPGEAHVLADLLDRVTHNLVVLRQSEGR